MNAFISTFPKNIVVSFPCGRIFASNTISEIISMMDDAGIGGSDYTWIGQIWDEKIFSGWYPIEHRTPAGDHLFTDRGNRVTFDREQVSDDEIRAALAHAKETLGNTVSLSGDDPVFTERMRRLAGEMGIIICGLNTQNSNH